MLVLVFLIYLPVRNGGLVWDDFAIFVHRPWLYSTDGWSQFLFHQYSEWRFYFRPLVDMLFIAQARVFDGVPGPIHLVSLALQLMNVTLVVLLARRIYLHQGQDGILLPLFAGVFYGLHPMLVETVAWISCQFDQVQVLFALLGLLFSLSIPNRWMRAGVVSTCFLFSALSKESAVLYPVLVVLFDWLLRSDRNQALLRRLTKLVRENWPVYVGLIFTGIAYLVLRTAVMGSLLGAAAQDNQMTTGELADEISFVYLRYWMVILGIPVELSPVHPVETMVFGQDNGVMAARLLACLALCCFGLLAFTRRFAFTGAIVIAATVYLFPALGFVVGHFDGSLYHERYATGAIAVTAALIPGAFAEWRPFLVKANLLRKLLPALAALWVAWAILNVRVTIPLWSNDLMLWRWASEVHPDSGMVKSNLIHQLTTQGHHVEAEIEVSRVLATGMDCPRCLVNGMFLAVNQGNVGLADQLNARLRPYADQQDDRLPHALYLLYDGYLDMREGEIDSATMKIQAALQQDPDLSFGQVILTEALVLLGRTAEASASAKQAESLMTYPPTRARVREVLERILNGERIYSTAMEEGPVTVHP
ncbi:hypothetical protein B1808_13255 [Pseudofulvimonas gallinarii]|nr:hypothetical protein B1808_13255 [Pseudofulvimonas gallinarii]